MRSIDTLEIRLFGEPSFHYGSRERRFGAPPKALELLALCLIRRTSLSRERVAELLWPDHDPDAARAEVRRHLYYLSTRALPLDIPWFIADKRSVQWNPAAPAWVDVHAFADLAATDGARAAKLYAGDLLPGIEAEWLTPHRDEFARQATQLLERLVDASLAAADHDAVAKHALHLASVDPWNERAVRALITSRMASGDNAGAVRTYSEFARRLSDELGVEPMDETRALYDAAVSLPRVARTAGNRLSSFVGRDEDRQRVGAALAAAPIVTLVGPGGVGKTRLAQEVARGVSAQSTLRVPFIGLAAVTSPSFVLAAIGSSLGLREEHGVSMAEAIVAMLNVRDTLLVIDNCEHVLDAVAEIVEELAAKAPSTLFLTTSREPLRIEGEYVVRIDPLDTEASVQLFLDRARTAGALDALAPTASAAVLAICRHLDGLPLAIELAAAQTYDHRIEAIAKLIDEKFAELRGGRRTAEPRQQSLRALLDWSVELLEPRDVAAFLCLGVLSGRFSARTANAVCSSGAPLELLLNKSLLARENDAFGLLETTRAYALMRLEAEHDADAVRVRHVRHCLTLAREMQLAFRTGIRPAWRVPYAAEMEHIRGALEWSIDNPAAGTLGIELAAELDVFWWDASLQVEGGQWIERALDALPEDASPQLVARCWLAAAWLRADGPGRVDAAARAVGMVNELAGDAERARAHAAFAYSAQYIDHHRDAMTSQLTSARAHAEAANDAYMMAYVTHLTADVLLREQHDARARLMYDDAMERYRSFGDERGVAMIYSNLAEGAFRRENLDDALRYSGEGLAMMRALGERRFSVLLLANISMYRISGGDAAGARAHAEEGYAVARESGLVMETAVFVAIFAMLTERDGDMRAAATLLGCADRLYRDGSFARDYTEAVLIDDLIARLRSALPTDEFARYHTLGAASDPDDLVRTALRAGTVTESSP